MLMLVLYRSDYSWPSRSASVAFGDTGKRADVLAVALGGDVVFPNGASQILDVTARQFQINRDSFNSLVDTHTPQRIAPAGAALISKSIHCAEL